MLDLSLARVRLRNISRFFKILVLFVECVTLSFINVSHNIFAKKISYWYKEPFSVLTLRLTECKISEVQHKFVILSSLKLNLYLI